MKKLVLPYLLWFMVGGAALLIGAVVATTYSQTQKIPFPGASSSGTTTTSSSSSFEKALNGYTKVVSTTDGKAPMFEIWVDKKKGGMLAKLPNNIESKKYYFALTVAGGEKFAGLQAGELYLYWKKFGDRIA